MTHPVEEVQMGDYQAIYQACLASALQLGDEIVGLSWLPHEWAANSCAAEREMEQAA
jgi:hypothetical protein